MTEEPDNTQAASIHSDSLTPEIPRHVRVGDGPAAVLLSNFLAAMNAVGDGAEEAYEAALAELRQRPEDVLIELARGEGACDETDYPVRWALIYTAGELRHTAAIPFLRNLVLTPISPERSEDPHSFSTVAEETVLRTTAVEGVGHLAVVGNDAAFEALFEFLEQPSLSIRRAAVQSILATRRGIEMRERVAACLPKDQQFLLEIKPMDVGKVQQIDDPQRHLREEARRAETEPSPRLPGAEPQTSKGDEPAPKAE